MAVQIGCRHFNGYKPCGFNEGCSESCPHLQPRGIQILVVHLEALGAVLRATSILPAIKRKYPQAQITWVTQAPAHHLLKHNPYISRVLTTERDDQLVLNALEFDVAYCVDKSIKAAGILRHTKYEKLYGFDVDPSSGVIVPATSMAEELWSLGLSNQKKFFENKKTETQLMIEALELGHYQRDEYQVYLTPDEKRVVKLRRDNWSEGKKTLIGINTGCSSVIPYKRLTVDFQREMIAEIAKDESLRVVLLGGPEDTQRNSWIAQGLPVVSSPTENGLRDGLCSTAAVDIVVSGDSLGLHMGIAFKKWMVAWFGPTCAHEIELYGRGEHILTSATCSPCWKRSCQKTQMCYDQVSLKQILAAVHKGIQWHNSTCKPLFSETSF